MCTSVILIAIIALQGGADVECLNPQILHRFSLYSRVLFQGSVAIDCTLALRSRCPTLTRAHLIVRRSFRSSGYREFRALVLAAGECRHGCGGLGLGLLVSR